MTTLETISPPCSQERTCLRAMTDAGADSRCPVRVEPGDAAPHIDGESWHYETRTGIPIRHPSAYAKRGWSSMVYYSSTFAVIVGEQWLVRWRRRGGVFSAEYRGGNKILSPRTMRQRSVA